MALVPIISQSWDTTSVFTPTRMNNIEQNLAIVSDATGVKYSNGVSVKDKIDSMDKEVSFSPTTNANGVVSSTYYNILQNKAILSAICTSEEDSIVVLGHNTAGNWLKVMNYDLTPIGNKQVTIKMWYKDLDYNP